MSDLSWRSRRWRPALGLAALLVASACGDGGGTGSDSASGAATCTPVGTELAARADQNVDVVLQEFSFGPATLETRAGLVTFVARNAGTENHELAFLPGGGDVPMKAGRKPDEGALERAGAFELEAFGPGHSCNATYELKPGRYTLFCLVTDADGITHYGKGMRGQLVVQ